MAIFQKGAAEIEQRLYIVETDCRAPRKQAAPRIKIPMPLTDRAPHHLTDALDEQSPVDAPFDGSMWVFPLSWTTYSGHTTTLPCFRDQCPQQIDKL